MDNDPGGGGRRSIAPHLLMSPARDMLGVFIKEIRGRGPTILSRNRRVHASFNPGAEDPADKTRVSTKTRLISASLLSFVIFMLRGDGNETDVENRAVNTARSLAGSGGSRKSDDKSLLRVTDYLYFDRPFS